jgi:hypothetical protein
LHILTVAVLEKEGVAIGCAVVHEEFVVASAKNEVVKGTSIVAAK